MRETKFIYVLNYEQGIMLITLCNDDNTKNKNCNALTTTTKSKQ